MDMIFDVAGNALTYIRDDFRSNRLRFFLELFAWSCSIVSAMIFAITVPEPPIVPLYGIFISGCAASAYCCWSRRSFGLLMNYICLITIDGIGLAKMLILH